MNNETHLYFFCKSLEQVASSKVCKLSNLTRSNPQLGSLRKAKMVDRKITAWSKNLLASPSPSASRAETFSNSPRKLSKLSSHSFPTSNMVTACFLRPCRCIADMEFEKHTRYLKGCNDSWIMLLILPWINQLRRFLLFLLKILVCRLVMYQRELFIISYTEFKMKNPSLNW